MHINISWLFNNQFVFTYNYSQDKFLTRFILIVPSVGASAAEISKFTKLKFWNFLKPTTCLGYAHWLSQSLDFFQIQLSAYLFLNDFWFASKITWWAAFIHNVCEFIRNPYSFGCSDNRRIPGVESFFWFVLNLKARIVWALFAKKSSAF